MMPQSPGVGWLQGVLAVLLLSAASQLQAVVVEQFETYGPSEPNGPTNPSCGYGPLSSTSWPDGNVASFTSASAALTGLPSHGCGACFQLSCASQASCLSTATPVNIVVIDASPSSSFSIPERLFEELAPLASGSVPTSVTPIACAPHGNLVLYVLTFRTSSGGYLKIAPFGAAGNGAIASVEIRSSEVSGTWLPATNTYGAVYEISNLPTLPLDIRITNAAGQTVVARSAITSSTATGSTVQTSVQFPSGAAPSASPAPPTARPIPPPATLTPPTTPVLALPPPATPVMFPPPPVATVAAATPPVSVVTTATPSAAATPPISVSTSATLPAAGTPTAVATAVAPAAAVTPPPAPAVPAQTPTPGQGGCQTVLKVLQATPDLSQWLSLIQANGQASAIGNANIKLTMFAPSNDALNANVPAGSPLGSGTYANVLLSDNSIRSAVVGYHITANAQPTSSFHVGQNITTTAAVNRPGKGQEPLDLTVAGVKPLKIQAVNGVGTVLTPDIPACGPSLVDVIDSLLLPFNAATGP